MKIVFMEAQSLGEDMDLSIFRQLGDVEVYQTGDADENASRIADADIIVMNKIRMDGTLIRAAKNVKLICITATGTDAVDLDYCHAHDIAVCNVRGYSTESVVQHTFAMLFYLWEKSRFYDDYVKNGEYAVAEGFGCFPEPFLELAGKQWGIIGLGAIGRRVAEVARAFGCHVRYYSASGQDRSEEFERVALEDLLAGSDIISIHAPLNDQTRNLIDREALAQMKPEAVLINVGRGGIIDDVALVEALESGQITAAGLDVFRQEPLRGESPLYRIKDSRKLYLTPHIAWATIESRTRCVMEVYRNIEAFLGGTLRNPV